MLQGKQKQTTKKNNNTKPLIPTAKQDFRILGGAVGTVSNMENIATPFSCV